MDCLDLQKIEYLELRKFNWKLLPLCVRNAKIRRKSENPELCKFYGKLHIVSTDFLDL